MLNRTPKVLNIEKSEHLRRCSTWLLISAFEINKKLTVSLEGKVSIFGRQTEVARPRSG